MVKSFFLFLSLFFSSFISKSQIVSIENDPIYYEISPTFNFKKGVYSITFDDGIISHFTKVMPLLSARNIPGTFYVITGKFNLEKKDRILNSFLNNHEIGSHTVNHINLRTASSSSIDIELFESQNQINTLLGKNACYTIAYPFGKVDEKVVEFAEKYYLGGRSVEVGYNNMLSLNNYRLRVQNFNEFTSESEANRWVDYAIHNEKWVIEMFHQVIDGSHSVPMDVFVRHIDAVKTRQNNLWISSVSDVLKYYNEYKNARIGGFQNDTLISLKLDDGLEDSIFNHLLSIKIKIPTNWEKISIDGGDLIKFEVVGENKFLLFNAIPDNRLIKIKPGIIKNLNQVNQFINIISLSPNPFDYYININLEVFRNCKISLSLSTLDGTKLAEKKEFCESGVTSIKINTMNCPKGIYILHFRINDLKEDFMIIEKLIKK